MATNRRWIDVHHHIAPPAYLEQGGAGVGGPLKTWSLAKSLEDLEQGGIETAIVSVTQLSKHIANNEQRRALPATVTIMRRSWSPTIPANSACSPCCRCPISTVR